MEGRAGEHEQGAGSRLAESLKVVELRLHMTPCEV